MISVICHNLKKKEYVREMRWTYRVIAGYHVDSLNVADDAVRCVEDKNLWANFVRISWSLEYTTRAYPFFNEIITFKMLKPKTGSREHQTRTLTVRKANTVENFSYRAVCRWWTRPHRASFDIRRLSRVETTTAFHFRVRFRIVGNDQYRIATVWFSIFIGDLCTKRDF